MSDYLRLADTLRSTDLRRTEYRRLRIPGLAVGLLVGAAVAALLTPHTSTAAPQVGAGNAESFAERCGGNGKSSTSVHGRNGRYDITVKQGRCRLEVEMRGDVEFSDDESGIASMSRRARLEITEEVGRDERRLVVTPGSGGEPEYSWSVDGRDADFDAEGRAWLGRMLPEIFRTTGIDAEARVGRILARAGVDGVLEEVRLISGDHTQRLYLETLLDQARLEPEELEDAIDVAGREIGSDFELAELLISTARDLDAESLRIAYARAAEEIGSDFELRRALTPLVEHRDVGGGALDVALGTARSIGSDFELAQLLVTTVKAYPEDEPLPEAFFTALGTVGSDFESRRVLDAAVAHRELTPETVAALLESSTDMGSDFEMAQFLISLARAYPIGDEVRPAFDEALGTVGSRYERERVLAALDR